MPTAAALSAVPALSLSAAQTLIEATAILAFAASGLLEAARRRLDIIGVCTVVALAAFGGGTLRDILLDRRPLFWVAHAEWLWILLGLSLLAMLFLRGRHFEPTERAIQWPDALGLGLFTAGGTQLALDAGTPAIVAVVMGMITAVFGGVLRDIVCNEIPSAFRDHRPYAVCAFVGGWCVVAGERLGVADWLVLAGAAAITFALRALALLLDLRLPTWRGD
ncbi:trimeric intracellular cation channel family protein [Azospira restricta]|uniref:Trimeric intracellular cation channel family protein n=1 Tax=Azospira restricta TaxID=404405 RepID=A0A974PWM4_9RHOO|nr:trimeric intracellular cation channel family protein [Azospira restricta]QRJ62745.1 trimeric intracellular cation channel family protein [Azospira restricta]